MYYNISTNTYRVCFMFFVFLYFPYSKSLDTCGRRLVAWGMPYAECRTISMLNAFGNSHLWKKIRCPAYCFRFSFFWFDQMFRSYHQSSRLAASVMCSFLHWIALEQFHCSTGTRKIYCNRDNKLYYFVWRAAIYFYRFSLFCFVIYFRSSNI